MYESETQLSRAVGIVDATATGRILVVDDDRAFGGFMLAALESKGHQAEWASSISDALTALYAGRFDLVIVDLRLPDGSGLDFLRDATDAGLLAGSSSIILTGHDFEEPHDIRVFRKGATLDPFLDRLGDIVARTQRRRAGLRRQPMADRSRANDGGHGPRKRPKIELVLYTSAASEKCQKAIRTVNAVLKNYNREEIDFSICDLATASAKADEDVIVFTPTLVKRGPGSRTWIVGNLDEPDLLIDLLEVNGVARRKPNRFD